MVADGRTKAMLEGRTVASYWQAHRLRRPPALDGIPPHAAIEADVIRRIQIHAHLIERKQLRVIQREQSLDQDERTCVHGFGAVGNSNVMGKIVEGPLDGFSASQRRNVRSKKGTLNQGRIVEVLLSRGRRDGR